MNFIKPVRKISRVFLHCSASDNPKHDNLETISQWHLARGFAEIGYHFYINKVGDIFAGRSLEKIPAAQKGYNTATIAICCGGEKSFSEIQMSALKDFCEQINLVYSGKITFHGHCEVEPNKLCPVFDYKKILNLDSRGKML